MKTPTVPTLTGEEQVAIMVIKNLCLLEGGKYPSTDDAYRAWLKMDEKLRQEMFAAWHTFTLNQQN